MNATPLFEMILHTSHPTPYFQLWNEIPEQVFVEFAELIFQDQPGEYFTQRIWFHEDRAYPHDPKRLDWVLELGAALGFVDEPYERVLQAYKVWQIEHALSSVEISSDGV